MLKAALVAIAFVPAAALAAPPETIAPHKIISAVEGDFNGDGSLDRAVLMDNGDTDADLVIYFNDGNGGFKPAGSAAAIAFNGGLAGNSPDLRLSKSGALQVHSENMAIGRSHWERTLTLSYRGGQFVVSGITASDFDTLDPGAGGACDINLLTGKGTSGRKKVTVKGGAVPLSQWTEDKIPAACQ
ncbi:FG-GAP repeat domain-containing protein [Asticcacaulis solisilvae]|uniref:FG-GAP repeat domain-containing protein n=1 Tax=Asticcacaulis solisilvae TaxID=1217274 RepID=UPI003FD8FC56